MAKQKKVCKVTRSKECAPFPRALPRDSCLDDWLERRLLNIPVEYSSAGKP